MRPRFRTPFLAASVVATAVAAAMVSARAAAPTPSRPRLLQSVDLQVPVAPAPVRIAGRLHLAYELHASNFRPFPVLLTRVEVLDSHGASLSSLEGAALGDHLGRPGLTGEVADPSRIGPGLRAVVYFWLQLPEGAAPPAGLRHRVTLLLQRPEGDEPVTVEGGPTAVVNEPPVLLGPPLAGGPWVALYDPALVRGHRTTFYTLGGRARIPARFAIDWVRLADDGSHARGDGKALEAWHGYGAEVLAVADGVVAAAVDDLTEDPDLTADTHALPLEAASGNFVSLDLGGGRFAFYEHLQHGSIRVRAGERVEVGQVLGRLGNSGSSSAGPHLHFHVGDGNEELAAEGLPYAFTRFEVLGGFASLTAAMSGQRWSPPPPASGGTRREELPAPAVVVRF